MGPPSNLLLFFFFFFFFFFFLLHRKSGEEKFQFSSSLLNQLSHFYPSLLPYLCILRLFLRVVSCSSPLPVPSPSAPSSPLASPAHLIRPAQTAPCTEPTSSRVRVKQKGEEEKRVSPTIFRRLFFFLRIMQSKPTKTCFGACFVFALESRCKIPISRMAR